MGCCSRRGSVDEYWDLDTGALSLRKAACICGLDYVTDYTDCACGLIGLQRPTSCSVSIQHLVCRLFCVRRHTGHGFMSTVDYRKSWCYSDTVCSIQR